MLKEKKTSLLSKLWEEGRRITMINFRRINLGYFYWQFWYTIRKIRVHEVRTDHTRAILDPQNYLTKYQCFRCESLFSLFNPIEKIEKYGKYETIEKTEDATGNYK